MTVHSMIDATKRRYEMRPAGDFRLMARGYAHDLKVSGPIGARPDTRIVNGLFECARVTLPRRLDRMTFSFPTAPIGPKGSSVELVQNFYYLDGFFVVTAQLRDFFVARLPNAIEVARVQMHHSNGTPADDAYFAIKVTKTIDCIDAQRSLHKSWPDEARPFAEKITSYELGPEVADEFANVGGSRYASYPNFRGVQKLYLREELIPSDAHLFRPAVWPGHLLISASFAEALEERCTGGTKGYYFWALSLDNPSKEYDELLHALR
jgi:hypothetical protein